MSERPRINRRITTDAPVRKTLKFAAIKRDQRAQPRAAIVADRTAEYGEDMVRGDKFPPVVVFEDRSGIYLADGFHRLLAMEHIAARETNRPTEIEALVYQGGLREAILYSCGANAAHGTRRSNADKRRAVTKLLEDEEWSRWSNVEIAKRCHVSEFLVRDMRDEITSSNRSDDTEPQQQRTYRNRHGGVSRMRTNNIGRRRQRARRSDISDVGEQINRMHEKVTNFYVNFEMEFGEWLAAHPTSTLSAEQRGALYSAFEHVSMGLARLAQGLDGRGDDD